MRRASETHKGGRGLIHACEGELSTKKVKLRRGLETCEEFNNKWLLAIKSFYIGRCGIAVLAGPGWLGKVFVGGGAGWGVAW